MKEASEALLNADELKAKLDILRPLSQTQTSRLKKLFDLDLTYNSNAIEGNTLTYSETKLVLREGITIGGKPLREHVEVTNHKAALDYIETLTKRAPYIVSEEEILHVHGLILRGIDDNNAGRYRIEQVYVKRQNRVIQQFPESAMLPTLIQEMLREYRNRSSDLHPIELAALFHLGLVKIHPFVDGNGRTARLLMNLVLMQNGYPPAVIHIEDRVRYISSVEHYCDTGDADIFIVMLVQSVIESLSTYIKTIEGNIVWE
ncbi:MAG: Fic family protein [Candidatus Margulisiibacteriota bacterium]|nr:MAG: hypothetical protein A2X43_02600 [Candidatus Margulisbacteria bacterium GWD2_39_127]OGI11167.1 MAG: hypothetical protein A2X41_00305 [Candidatus Margulisbacteria bacterium GWE2_39_32]PZM83925.1 MAG: Fic family protein [Candidatus Margulisiibacteriota bacterium]HAR64171.1 hypothetical protein [Candidatus Margulisiibacteriota bacterium]HCY36139.1 hypothetical protein [Candidatus Margulisiibacteriota bacterium]